MKIICYGDSNTYGYDPNGVLELRYPEDVRWVDAVKRYFGDEVDILDDVVNLGQNGREVPDNGWESAAGVAAQLGKISAEGDIITVMLGGNDVLLSDLGADAVCGKMERFLQEILGQCPKRKIVLIAPIEMKEGYWVPDGHYIEESVKLTEMYRGLARELEIDFLDPNQWQVDVTEDGVHFTAEGCRNFAQGMVEYLEKIL